MQACNVELCEILRWCLIDVITIIWRLQIARMKIISHLPVEVQYVARRCIAAKTPILFQMKLRNVDIVKKCSSLLLQLPSTCKVVYLSTFQVVAW